VGKWLQAVERLMGGGPNGPKRVQTFRWMLLLGLVGAAMMILHSFLEVKEIDPPEDSGVVPPPEEREALAGDPGKPKSPFEEYEEQVEASLREILQNVVGVSDVDVLVTIESTEELVVYRNVTENEQITDEQDRNGAKRHITQVTRSGDIELYEVSGGQEPIILKKIRPKVRGVIVVAGGAENLTVQKMIRDMVSRGLDVPVHRVAVVPRKQP